MQSLEIPAGTTVQTLLESVAPDLHARLVPAGAATDPFTAVVRIDGAGDWLVEIRGRAMSVSRLAREAADIMAIKGAKGGDPPTLWLFATARTVEHFLADAAGPRRLLPRFDMDDAPASASGGVAATAILSDPRILKRVAMANGRIELALRDDDGQRLAIVLGFGDAARRRIDPEDADVVVETGMATLERVLSGALSPEAALLDGDVTVRGKRIVAMQLALAVAPFYPQSRGPKSRGPRSTK